jgi:hypothetical protein
MPKSGVTVTVRIDPHVVELLDGGVAEGVYRTAEHGKERSLELARSKFRSTERIERHAYAVGFDGVARKGDRRGPDQSDFRGKGPVAYFGNDWFVMRFHEQGTVKMPARPTIAPAAAELGDVMPGDLAAAVKAKGF